MTSHEASSLFINEIYEIICSKRKQWQEARPFLVAISGIPGSGKTTAAEALEKRIPGSLHVPMDGYHYSLAELSKFPDADARVYRRGAPDTFNAAQLALDLAKVREGSLVHVSFPGFDHAKGDPAPGTHVFIRAEHSCVIVEGLYLQLESIPEWAKVSALFDLKIFLKSDIDAAIERLKIRNQAIPGYTVDEILRRCDDVDRKNAERIVQDAGFADVTVNGFTHGTG